MPLCIFLPKNAKTFWRPGSTPTRWGAYSTVRLHNWIKGKDKEGREGDGKGWEGV